MLKKLMKIFRAKDNQYVSVGRGVLLEDIYSTTPTIHDINMGYSERLRHWMTFGTTGCGKTKLIEHLVDQDIRAGRSICVIDPKGDRDLLAKIIDTAKSVGRESEIMLINPVYPDISLKINPFAHYYRPEEIVQHIIAGLPISKEPFFTEVAKEISLIAVFSYLYLQKKTGRNMPLTIAEMRRRIGRTELEDLGKQLQAYQDDPEISSIYEALEQAISSPQDYFSKITTSLRTTLTQLSVGSIGEIVGNSPDNTFIERLEQGKPVILVAQTGSLLFRDPALSLARIFTSMLQALVGRFYASQRVFDPPLMLYIDEASNVLYNGIEDLFNKSRGAGMAIHALTQSVADIAAHLGPDRSRVILDNCNAKLFFKVNDPLTSKYVSEMIGKRVKAVPQFNTDVGLRYTETDQNVVDEADSIKLRPRQFYMFTEHKAYRGRTADVLPATIEIKNSAILSANGNYESNDLDTPACSACGST